VTRRRGGPPSVDPTAVAQRPRRIKGLWMAAAALVVVMVPLFAVAWAVVPRQSTPKSCGAAGHYPCAAPSVGSTPDGSTGTG
jgi:hypothetical protein